MYQAIVISPTFVQHVLDLTSENRLSVFANLITEEILSDAELVILKEYQESINRLIGREKIIMEAIFGDLNQRVRPQKNIIVKNRAVFEYDNYETEIKIAENTTWKIILTHKIDNKKVNEVNNKYNIEISDCHNYLKPSYTSRIRTIETVSLSPGKEFNFKKWIEKYIIDAKMIKIEDGYMCMDPAYQDLSDIISVINPEIDIELITLNDHVRNKFRHNNIDDKIKAEERLKSLEKEYKLKNFKCTLLKNKKMLKDRMIKTDKFIINHGHALGAVNELNQVRSQFSISVQKNT